MPGVPSALLVTVGYTVAITAVFTMSGGMVAMTLAKYTSWHPPWGPLTLVLTVGAIWLTARGVKLSTAAVGAAVLVQVAIMVVVCVIVLVDQRAHLSGIPFSWAHLTGGLAGLSAGFPLALYMFIGWENGPALAEECRNPRRTVPRALYISVAIAAALFVLFAYATITGFGYDVSSIGRSSVPFLTVADRYLGGAAVLAWIAGIVSVLATLVAAARLPIAHALRRRPDRAPARRTWRMFTDGPARRLTRSWSWQAWGWGSSGPGGCPTSSAGTPDR